MLLCVLSKENETILSQNKAVQAYQEFSDIELPLEMGSIKKSSFTQTRGLPILHEPEVHCTQESEHHLCQASPHAHLLSGHQLRAKNDAPIVGILTQPVPQEWKDANPEVFSQD